MGDLITFCPRRSALEFDESEPLTGTALRERIEAAAEVAVDTAEQLISILDAMDGCPDDEDGGDAEPSLAAPENAGSQATWTRGNDQDREAEAPEPVIPEVAIEPWPLPWSGSSNVVAVCGAALLDLVGG